MQGLAMGTYRHKSSTRATSQARRYFPAAMANRGLDQEDYSDFPRFLEFYRKMLDRKKLSAGRPCLRSLYTLVPIQARHWDYEKTTAA